jgi:hypothetical protein
MARRLPKPLVPLVVGASAITLGLFAMTPSFAGMTQPIDPINPTTAPVVPTPSPDPAATGSVPWLDEDGNIIISISPSKPDMLRDPTVPPATIGSCTACLGVDP